MERRRVCDSAALRKIHDFSTLEEENGGEKVCRTNAHEENSMRYHAYLLRLWISIHPEPGKWRASLENIHTHERLVFTELEELMAFLLSLTREEADLSEPSLAPFEEDVP